MNLEWWDLPTGKQLTIHSAADFVNSVFFSSDGKAFATGGSKTNSNTNLLTGVLEIWNLATGEVRDFDTAAAPVDSVSVSPNGETLAAGGTRGARHQESGVLELWNVSTGTRNRTLDTSDNAEVRVAFSPTGETLAVGGNKWGIPHYLIGGLELWSVSKGK